MNTLYKLTRRDRTTHNGFLWTPGEWAPELSGEGELCGPGWYHVYLSPQLALLLNPIHANLPTDDLRLWRAEGVIGRRDHALKVGTTRLRITQEISVPAITTEQHVTFALHCALAVCAEPGFIAWATDWLSGVNRTATAARAARAEAWAEAWAEEEAAGWAEAAAAAAAAAEAAWAAAEAASWAAQTAAAWAADATTTIDLIAIASAALMPWEPPS